MAEPWGQESLDYARSEEDSQRPTVEADRVAALDVDLWIAWISDVEQLTIQVRTQWVLMDIHNIRNGTCTMANVIFNHPEGRDSPPPTMEHPSQWRYVATPLMAHMGAYTPDALNQLHRQWHHRAALRIQEVLIGQNIWTIRTPLPRGQPSPDKATGHQRQRSPTTQGPPRQMARTSHSDDPPEWRPHAIHNGAHSGRSPTPGRTTAIKAPLGHRSSRGGPEGWRGPNTRAARRPQQLDG